MATKIRISKTIDPGDDPKKKETATVSTSPTPPLTPQQMQEWNSLLDHIKSKGYEGSEQLDHDKKLGESLFNEWKQKNPQATINYDVVKTVQGHMQKLRDSAQDFAARHNDPNAKNIMSNVSKVDGFLGSKTSQFRFPQMTMNELQNNNLVSSTNLGLVNSNLQPTGAAAKLGAMRKIPPNAKLEKLYDNAGNATGMGYTDPSSGDIIRVQ